MTASDNLSDGQFFHGSHAEFEPGATIEPGQSGGYKGEQAWRGDRVWLAKKPEHAEEWAEGGHLYRVQAHDPKEHDPDDWDYNANVSAGAALGQVHAAKATVIGRTSWDSKSRQYKDTA